MEEIWKDIPDYEGLYQVSNLGRIKSLQHKNKKIIKQTLTKSCRYYAVGLHKNNERKTLLVHKLVAEVFLNKRDFKSMPNEDRNNIDLSKLEVNHKDEDKINNCIGNLEWCTHLYNMKYGNCLKRSKANQHRKKINQYDLDGNFIKQWNSVSEIKKKLNITNVASSCIGRYKQCNGFIWKYADDNN